MPTSVRRTTSLVSFLVVGLATTAWSQETGYQKLEIAVLVYNYAEVPRNSLERAKQEAARVFRQAGVDETEEAQQCAITTPCPHQHQGCDLDGGGGRDSDDAGWRQQHQAVHGARAARSEVQRDPATE